MREAIKGRIDSQMHGGGHERGLRSGTLPTHQIAGMGAAFRLAREEMAAEVPRLRALRDKLWQGLSRIESVTLNGDMESRIAHNLNISIAGCNLPLTSLTEVAISSASACETGHASHVLAALDADATATVMRISVADA